MKKLMSFLVLGFALSNLTACSKTREQFDFSKKAPDEFAIVTRAPLEMPSSFDLPPPTPGAQRPQETQPELQAKQALFGEDNKSKVTDLTQGEAILLQKTGATTVNPNIRDVVDAENVEVVKENTSTFNKILGKVGKKTETPATVVDPVKEHERIQENIKAGKPITTGETPSIDQ